MDASEKHSIRFVAMVIAMLLDCSTASAQLEPPQRCTAKGLSIDHCVRSESDPLLLYFDNFEQSADGWSDRSRQTIGNDTVLGGYCKYAETSVSRTYELPVAHRGLHVRATVYLLDKWEGQAVYLKVDGQLVRLLYHKHCDVFGGTCGINVAGDEAISDAVGVEMDGFVPHNAASATIEFGTTLTDRETLNGCLASYAIDDVAISVF